MTGSVGGGVGHRSLSFHSAIPGQGKSVSGRGAIVGSVRKQGALGLRFVGINIAGLVLWHLEIEARLATLLPIPLVRSPHGVPIGRPFDRIEGAPKQGPAIQQQALGIAQALLQARILLLGGQPLPFQGLEPLFQQHQTLGQQVKRASEILGAAADPE